MLVTRMEMSQARNQGQTPSKRIYPLGSMLLWQVTTHYEFVDEYLITKIGGLRDLWSIVSCFLDLSNYMY